MSCCDQEIQTFVNASTVSIPYTSSMLSLYGSRPTINVYYQTTTGYEAAGVFTRVELQGNPINTIFIDNGGPATGFIKIS